MKIVWLLLILPFSVFASVSHTVGVARDVDSQSVRYFEHHQYFQDGTHLIRYYTPEWELMAAKDLRYSAKPQHPEIQQIDYRRGLSVLVETNSDSIVMQKTLEGETEEIRLPLSDRTVIDAGFDAFIRETWSALNDDPITVDFAIAGQSRVLPMRISRLDASSVSITPKNWLIRQLLPEIRLKYDDQRRLSRYEGFSNFSSGKGESKTVAITFRHFESDARLEMPLSDWIGVLQTGP